MLTLKTAAASILLAALAAGPAVGARATDNGPTCSDVLDIEVHGQHVVGDYVTGLGHDTLQWPPRKGVIGEEVSANRGAALPGGPGPGFHFPNNVAPGASFCTDSNSPGFHF